MTCSLTLRIALQMARHRFTDELATRRTHDVVEIHIRVASRMRTFTGAISRGEKICAYINIGRC